MTTPKEALEQIAARSIAQNDDDAKELRRQLYHIASLAKSALASLEGDAVEMVALEFRPDDQVPDVERGSMRCCIVVTENEQGKHFAFPGYYLNAYPLQYDECRCDEPCEDGCPTTGWFYDESNFEYENCYYPIATKILRWALIPDPDAILSTIAPDDAAIRADEREKCAKIADAKSDAVMAEAEAAHEDKNYNLYGRLECQAGDYADLAAAIRSQEAGR